jgi:SAM-dependent methyltransferase
MKPKGWIDVGEHMNAVEPWDRAAAGWNAQAPLIRAWLSDATPMMLDAACIKPGASVLDIAAGAGDQTMDLAQRVGPRGHVLATDASATILDLALDNARAAGHQHVTIQVADAQKLDQVGHGFDAVVCRLGLMFCEDPDAAVRGIHAALKPGGHFSGLVFAEPPFNPCLVLQLQVARHHTSLPPATHENLCRPGMLMSLGSPTRMSTLLSTAGFVNVKVRHVVAPFRVSSAIRYVEFLRSAASPIIDMLARLTDPLQRAAWDDLHHQLKAFDTSSGWVGPKTLLLFSAQRGAHCLDTKSRAP